jgi:tRNA threonylcarbamoyladenosine biosynthesis protein TsaE
MVDVKISEKMFAVASASDMEALGARLATGLRGGGLIYIRGPLGVGKTTLVRGVLRGFGHRGSVKSPTFTLVEPYNLDGQVLYHFDLYRLKQAEELEFMGWRDYVSEGVCLVEWPERGESVLPTPDLDVMIEELPPGRRVVLSAKREQGNAILRCLYV